MENKTYSEIENDIKAILLNRLTFENCEKFKENICLLKDNFKTSISQKYLKILVGNEQSQAETENRIYQLIKRTKATITPLNRYFKIYVFGKQAVKTKETLNFLSY